MKSLKQVLVVAAISGVLGAMRASADIAWFDTPTNRVFYDDGVTALFGYKGSNDISCFVQFILAGPDNTVAPAVNSGTGVSGDDVLVAWTYVGANLPGGAGSTSHYGWVSGGTFSNEVAGDFYYVRAWTAPSPDFTNGLVPVSGTNFYGNSGLVQAQAGFDAPNPPQNFNFGGASGFATTLTAVPEPGTLTLTLAACIAALLRRRLYRHEDAQDARR